MQSPTRRHQQNNASFLRLGVLELDATHSRAARAGREIPLTPREYALLEILVRHEGRVFSLRSLYARIAQVDEGAVCSLQLDMETLQEKINGRGEPPLIYAAGSVGYVLHTPFTPIAIPDEPKASQENRQGAEA